jgi:hypothetical protein
MAMMLNPPEKPGVWPESFNTLTPAEMHLCVRSLAAIFWEKRSREYGADRYWAGIPWFLQRTGTDAGTEELMRIALYTEDMATAQYVLTHFERTPPGTELYPMLPRFLERMDLSSAAREHALALRAFSAEPLDFNEGEEVTRAVVKELAGRTDWETVLAVVEKHWQKTFDLHAHLANAYAEARRSRAIAQRRERGLAGKL